MPRYNAAIQAVRAPDGSIACANPAAVASGCVPLNIIGGQTPSAAALAYILPGNGPYQHTRQTQDVASFSVSGEPLQLPAGALSVAFGSEYRHEFYQVNADPYGNGVVTSGAYDAQYPSDPLLNPQGGNWYAGNYRDGRGAYSVYESFLEVNAPLFNSDGVGKANLNAAGRATNYSTSGTVYTWKVGATWDTPVDGIRFRGVTSRDIRAPNLSELFAAPVTSNRTGTTDPFNPGRTLTVLQTTTGNTALRPEVARNTEFGVILSRPSWAPRLNISVDYYRIKIKSAIAALDAQTQINLCFAGVTFTCNSFDISDPNNASVTVQPFNFASIFTDGFDIEASYQVPLSGIGLPGQASLRGLATHVKNFVSDRGLAAGVALPVPETALSANGRPGLKGEYFSDGAMTRRVATRQDRTIDFDWDRAPPVPGLSGKGYGVRWTGQLTPPGPGRYRLRLDVPRCFDCEGHDPVKLWLDGKPLITDDGSDSAVEAEVTVTDAKPHDLRIDYVHASEDGGIGLRWVAPIDAQRGEALAAAGAADVVVVFTGLSPTLEGEALRLDVPGFLGGDRTAIELPEPQHALLETLATAGKPIVVVQLTGSAIADPWSRDHADAVVAAWYPGQSGGTAIARMLAGDINPGGRLPVTVYATTRDLPAYIDYSMKNRTYRFFSGTPLYPFGHGLSYTRFAYAPKTAPIATVTAGQPLAVSVTVTNTGKLAGDEVVQAYLAPVDPQEQGRTIPVLQRQLVGFRRIPLRAGEVRTVDFAIDPRSLSMVEHDGTHAVVPGRYRLFVGGGQPGDAAGIWTDVTITGTRTVLPK